MSTDDRNESLNDIYSSLYNSLGVEPGLLNKTNIGRNITQKYRADDNIDAKVYALKCLYKLESDNDSDVLVTIHNSSPFYGHDISPAPDIDHSFSEFIRMRQLDDHLTNEEVVKEISKYLEQYAPNYFIKKLL